MKLLDEGRLFVGGFEEGFESCPSLNGLIQLFLHISLLCLDFLDDVKDVVTGNEPITHSFNVIDLTFDPVKDACERILQKFTRRCEVLHQLVLLATNHHSI